ncbi:MAG: aminomethyl-transferring glycine dehydrogenase subunit GcvPB [Deltaproteobacteria bacterium]|nr:aminomethyl-transferring glycine dehydrogenase subunit GcvPB [Deltaproteobacteria bacterium]MBW2359928.1 aminomethyl-transferring glycine dehydrogenase subunit GcvPB [Deltaproteobacteria bacterium]
MSDPRARIGNTGTGFSYEEPLVFELSRPGRIGYSLPAYDVPPVDAVQMLPDGSVRDDIEGMPEVSEVDVVRHFTRMSTWNASVDLGLYPLGSCTMKYNPKINERAARLGGFADAHPLQPASEQQGFLELCHRLENELAEICGMDRVTLQPAAGAQGELAGIMMIRAYHEHRGELRSKILVPDSAHGTNPASAALNGYEVVAIPSDEDGILHPEAIEAVMSEDVAGLMITNPSTLGLFEEHVVRICEIVHAKGGLVYGDGANLNALLGIARPGDLGIDVMHINLHKTFSTPHGGGGPGSGPVGVKNVLAPYLPTPVVRELAGAEGAGFVLDYDLPQSIGRLHANFGNAGMFVRAHAYIRSLGPDGLKRCAEMAVLNANYLLARLRTAYHVPFDRAVMHECVLTDRSLQDTGVTTLDVAKRLIDYGYHPPTIYFPLIVHGAIMIEPTESESLDGLDRFADAMLAIAQEAREDADTVRTAPHHTRRSRLDETRAARKPILRWQPAARD